MINGNWEVPTLVDLKKQGKLTFDYGVAPFPKLFENQRTWADSHQLANRFDHHHFVQPFSLLCC
jgi:multiple sugar transport system substrate-binding protein